MLVIKKASKGRTAFYIFLIILMLSGTGFMLYQGQQLSKVNSPADNQAQSGELMPAEVAVPGDETAVTQPLGGSLGAGLEENQAPAANQIDDTGIDKTIFSSQKFKELKENVLVPRENSTPGNRDPFSPGNSAGVNLPATPQ